MTPFLRAVGTEFTVRYQPVGVSVAPRVDVRWRVVGHTRQGHDLIEILQAVTVEQVSMSRTPHLPSETKGDN